MEHYLNYYEIFDMFQNERFLSDDPDIEEYRNILKRGIHTVVACPELFPYNDTCKVVLFTFAEGYRIDSQCFGLPIASLKVEDIQTRYKTHEPIVSLNESFLDKFGVEHKDFETLMEDWFFNEEWPMKKGERNVPAWYLKIPYKIMNTMICRLYGEEANTHFRMEWFPMAYTVVKTGQDFN
jgi:hypothetical protein